MILVSYFTKRKIISSDESGLQSTKESFFLWMSYLIIKYYEIIKNAATKKTASFNQFSDIRASKFRSMSIGYLEKVHIYMLRMFHSEMNSKKLAIEARLICQKDYKR